MSTYSQDQKPFKLLQQYPPFGERQDFVNHLKSYFNVGDKVTSKSGKIYTVEKTYAKKRKGREVRVVDVVDEKAKQYKALDYFYFTLVK